MGDGTAGDDLSERVGAVIRRLLAAGSWSVRRVDVASGDSKPSVVLDAGAVGDVSWFVESEVASGPEIFVVGDQVLARATFPAYWILGCDSSFERFERELRGRSWVRFTLGWLLDHAPGWLPAVRAAAALGQPAPSLPVRRVDGPPDGEGGAGDAAYVSEPSAGDPRDERWIRRWTFAGTSDRAALRIEGPEVGVVEARLPGPGRCPHDLPRPEDVVDADELMAALARTAPTPPRAPRGYRVQFLANDHEEGRPSASRYPWVLTDPQLHVALGVDNNVEAEDQVRQALRAGGQRLDAGVVFDSAGDCFYAYAASSLAAEQLAALIAKVVARKTSVRRGRRPRG